MLFRRVSRALHAKYTIIGCGDAGKSMEKLILNYLKPHRHEIRIIDPVTEYTYQSGLTMVGGGLKDLTSLRRDKLKMLNFYTDLVQDSVQSIEPENNKLTTSSGQTFTYDNLILASGVEPRPDLIPGLLEALEDENVPVGTIYLPKYAVKYNRLRDELAPDNDRKLKAIFTQPSTPIKCGGAPQKILHLSEDSWEKKKIDSNIEFNTGTGKIFPSNDYIESLEQLLRKKKVTWNTNRELVSVDGPKRVAAFKDLLSGEIFEEEFDIMHVTPPCRPADFISSSGLSAPNGFADVDIHTLQHQQYPNIWALGDCANLPTSKTASAVNSQIWTVIQNMEYIREKNNQREDIDFKKNLLDPVEDSKVRMYSGYSACPVLTGNNKVMLCEFDYSTNMRKTFPFWDNKKPQSFFYFLKYKVFPDISIYNQNWFVGYMIDHKYKGKK